LKAKGRPQKSKNGRSAKEEKKKPKITWGKKAKRGHLPRGKTDV